jgi:Xaa-Pro aminopeptidase
MQQSQPAQKTNLEYFAKRRQLLAQKIPDSVLVLWSGKLATRSHDTEYGFRQNSNFYYLTGFQEPDSVLVMDTRQGKLKTILFVQPRVPEMELWTGKRLGPERAPASLQVDEAYSIEDFAGKMPEILKNCQKLFCNLLELDQQSISPLRFVRDLYQSKKSKFNKPTELVHLNPLIETMRLFKDELDLDCFKKGAAISVKAMKLAMAACRPGMYEYEIQALLEWCYKAHGAEGAAYEPIVAGGNNANILHYISNRCELKAGELLLIDAACEYQVMATDITRTFPVSGKFSPAQKDIYQLVLQAQKECLKIATPKLSWLDLHLHCTRVLTQGLLDLKVLKGSVDENIELGKIKTFYPHGTGHWLGLDVHDQNPYYESDLAELKLMPGTAFTVEPGLYFDLDNPLAPEAFKGIGVRIEDDILMTSRGIEVLTAGLAKEVAEVEELCQQKLDFKQLTQQY